jgi:hypothetical protein
MEKFPFAFFSAERELHEGPWALVCPAQLSGPYSAFQQQQLMIATTASIDRKPHIELEVPTPY